MSEETLEGIGRLLRGATSILVVSHVRPDGDAIGSLLGLGISLQSAGKVVQMVMEDSVPANLRHLPAAEGVQRNAQGSFDCIVAVDCSDVKRLGGVLNGYGPPDVNIDHHATNMNFARFNLVDVEAVATAEILAEKLLGWGFPINSQVASALLTGIITDTIGFRTANVGAKTMRIAAELMERGANLADLYARALVNRPFEVMRYWGAGLARLQRNGAMVWTSLTQEDRRISGYAGRDDADLINLLSAIEGVQVAVVFVEQPDGEVKVSWRAQPGIDVAQIASLFGGGGHLAAAGAEINGSLEEVRAQVLSATQKSLAQSTEAQLNQQRGKSYGE